MHRMNRSGWKCNMNHSRRPEAGFIRMTRKAMTYERAKANCNIHTLLLETRKTVVPYLVFAHRERATFVMITDSITTDKKTSCFIAWET